MEDDFADQVAWTSAAELYNDSSLNGGTIGMVALAHQNFSQIVSAVLRRNPEAEFRLVRFLADF